MPVIKAGIRSRGDGSSNRELYPALEVNKEDPYEPANSRLDINCAVFISHHFYKGIKVYKVYKV